MNQSVGPETSNPPDDQPGAVTTATANGNSVPVNLPNEERKMGTVLEKPPRQARAGILAFVP